jgi:ProP effector
MGYYMTRNEVEDFIQMLTDQYPKCFFTNPKLRRPIKKGIEADLEKNGCRIPHHMIARVVEFYTGHFGYKYNLQAGAKRIDLNGKEVGTVTEQEQQSAQTYIKERKTQLNASADSHKVLAVSFDGPPKTPKAPEPQPQTDADDPVARLQTVLESVRQAMANATEPALRNTFAIAGLEFVIAEAQQLIARLRQASDGRHRTCKITMTATAAATERALPWQLKANGFRNASCPQPI